MKIPRTCLRLARPLDVKPKIGIYFLLDSEHVVYIGQSSNIDGRISQHRYANRFRFDSAQWFAVAESDLAAYEGALIRYFKPPFSPCGPAFLDLQRELEILISLGILTTAQARSAFITDALKRRRKRKDRDAGEELAATRDALKRLAPAVLDLVDKEIGK